MRNNLGILPLEISSKIELGSDFGVNASTIIDGNLSQKEIVDLHNALTGSKIVIISFKDVVDNSSQSGFIQIQGLPIKYKDNYYLNGVVYDWGNDKPIPIMLSLSIADDEIVLYM